MMKLVLQLLGGSGGGWILLAGLLAATAAGGSAAYVARGIIDAPAIIGAQLGTEKAKVETQTCRADHETARADGNAKVVGELQAAAAVLTGLIQDLENKRITRDAVTAKFLEALGRLPKTSVCGASEPEHIYRSSVQPSRRPAVP
jgi:hypothetical protein